MKRKEGLYHLMAFITVVIWGATFISTKVLLSEGLNPSEIMIYRFLIAYFVLFCFDPHFHISKNFKEEFRFVLLGITGGSLYFFTENTALNHTLASNVSIIVSTAPIITVILLRPAGIKRFFIIGSLMALLGVALVVFNGNFILKLSPLGDILSLIAAFSWAIYTVILKKISSRYDTLYITRKVFFWGVVTLAPALFFAGPTTDPAVLFSPDVLWNLMFLGIFASLLGYAMWNKAVKQLGSIRTNNYIYLVPVVTMLTSSIILNEPVTAVMVCGVILILGGVFITEKGMSFIKMRNHDN